MVSSPTIELLRFDGLVEICGRAQLAPTELKAFCVWRLDWVGGGLGFGGSKPPALRYCGLIKRLVEYGWICNRPYDFKKQAVLEKKPRACEKGILV